MSSGEVDDLARAICTRFSGEGYRLAAPALLQPAELFVGLSGEDMRRRLFLVTDPSGAEMCLRPDFTIPVARAYLDSDAPKEARYTYCGPAFRYRRDGTASQVTQAGIEIFGAKNGEAAEKEVLRHAVENLLSEGLTRLDVRLGDPGLFAELLACLDLPDGWKRRLRRHFWRHDLPEDLARAMAASDGNGGDVLVQALAGLDKRAAAELVEAVLALAGIVPVGGRSAEEIAQRFMDRATGGPEALSERAVRIVRAYLEIDSAPGKAIAAIRKLFAREELAIGGWVDGLERRLAAVSEVLEEAGAKQARVTFDAEFGRRFEYYTGLVFEIRDPRRPDIDQIAGGGRYDQLLTDLGGQEPLSAVGCAIYVDRLLQAGRA